MLGSLQAMGILLNALDRIWNAETTHGPGEGLAKFAVVEHALAQEILPAFGEETFSTLNRGKALLALGDLVNAIVGLLNALGIFRHKALPDPPDPEVQSLPPGP